MDGFVINLKQLKNRVQNLEIDINRLSIVPGEIACNRFNESEWDEKEMFKVV